MAHGKPRIRKLVKSFLIKWYKLIIFNEDGKIAYFSDWFDVAGIQVQIEAK